MIIRSIRLLEKVVLQNSYKAIRFINSIDCKMNNQITDEAKRDAIHDQNNGQLDDSNEHQSKRLKTEDNNSLEVNKVNEDNNQIRQKTRKWILLLSYCGHGYYGMQRQSWDAPLPTIEGYLMESLWKSGAITEDKYRLPHTARFQRAARTDKGVSAIKQIVSVLLPINFPELIPKVNDLLPPQIRLISCKRVTKFFDAKNFCDGRTYSYLMPSYSLCPLNEFTSESFRMNDQTINEFNEILSLYIGTHNFHNFTAHKKPTDPSAFRYIMEMNCSQPFIKDDIEFVVVRVKGQSFMLHQIRKMIGLAIAVMRGLTNKETIIKAFQTSRLDIPMAPGLGLLLEEVHYERYNHKYGGDGIHEPIKWDENNDVIDQFKHEFIYPVVVETEKKEMSMFQWLQTLPLHTYDVREDTLNVALNQQVADQQNEENKIKRGGSPLFKAYLNAKVAAGQSSNETDPKEAEVELNLNQERVDSV